MTLLDERVGEDHWRDFIAEDFFSAEPSIDQEVADEYARTAAGLAVWTHALWFAALWLVAMLVLLWGHW